MDHTDQFKLVLVTATDLIIKNHQLSMMLKPGMVQRVSQTAADRICLLHIRFHKYCAGRYLQRDLFPFHLCILKSFYNLIVYLLQFRFGYLFKTDHKLRTGEPVYISFSLKQAQQLLCRTIQNLIRKSSSVHNIDMAELIQSDLQ